MEDGTPVGPTAVGVRVARRGAGGAWVSGGGGAGAGPRRRAPPGARVVERDGVTAAVVPAVPERAVVNSVVYDDAAGLAAAYGEVAAAYAEIGAVWTVWVPSGDERARAVLLRAGHALDAAPAVMAMDLRQGVERPPAGALDDWT